MIRVLLILFFAGLAGTTLYTLQLQKQVNQQTLLIKEKSDLIEKLQGDLDREKKNEQAQTEEAQGMAQKLQTQLQYETGVLDSLKQRLQSAQSGNVAKVDTQNMNQIRPDLQEITSQSHALGAQDRALGNEGKYANELNRQSVAQYDAQLDTAIITSQSNIRTILEEINQTKRTPTFDQAAQLQKQETQLAEERANLDQLKQQHQYDNLNTNQEVSAQRANLRAQEEQLRTQYNQEKAQFDQMQRDLDSQKKSQQSKNQLVHDIQVQIDAQKTKIGGIQDQIKDLSPQ